MENKTMFGRNLHLFTSEISVDAKFAWNAVTQFILLSTSVPKKAR